MNPTDLEDFESLEFASVLLSDFGVEPFASGGPKDNSHALGNEQSTSKTGENTDEAELLDSSAKGPATTKATREKLRRERLNDRFSELGKLLNLEGSNVDKLRMLSAAVEELKALREEVAMLKNTNSRLHMANTMTSKMAVSLLKAQKDDGSEEEEDTRPAKRVKSESSEEVNQKQAAFPQLSAPTQMPQQAPANMPFMMGGMPGMSPNTMMKMGVPDNMMKMAVPPGMPMMAQAPMMWPGPMMWQNMPMSMWMPQSSQDNSQDHLLRPPVA